MAGEDSFEGTYDDREERERKRRSAVLPGLVLLVAFLVVAWLIWTYAQRPVITTDQTPPGAAGEATVNVPDVRGLTEDDAVRVLSDAGFSVSVDTSYDQYAEPGTVANQDPPAGVAATQGAVVVIAVSTGPDETITDAQTESSGGTAGGGSGGSQGQVTVSYVTMPKVTGLKEAAALDKIEAAGLDPRPMYQPRYDRVGVVYQQDPAAGTRVERGRKVFVLIGSLD